MPLKLLHNALEVLWCRSIGCKGADDFFGMKLGRIRGERQPQSASCLYLLLSNLLSTQSLVSAPEPVRVGGSLLPKVRAPPGVGEDRLRVTVLVMETVVGVDVTEALTSSVPR